MWLNRVTCAMRPFWRLYWDLRLVGDVRAIPHRGPLVVVANHTSYLDPWFVSILFPRGVHYLIDRNWYERSPFWNSFFRANGTVPVEPGDPDATLAAVRGMLGDGKVVGIFPEGGISADGTLQRFRGGAAWVAASSGVPVIPLGIRGAFDVFPRGLRWPRPGRVTIEVGPALRFPNGEPDKRALAEFRKRMFSAVQALT